MKPFTTLISVTLAFAAVSAAQAQ